MLILIIFWIFFKIPIIYLPDFNFSSVTENFILEFVKHMAPKKSKNHFGLSNSLVKDTIDCQVNPLTALVYKCFAQGKFPTSLKITKCGPIFKKVRHDQLNHYCRIALFPVLSKTIEIVLGNQFYVFQNLIYYFVRLSLILEQVFQQSML